MTRGSFRPTTELENGAKRGGRRGEGTAQARSYFRRSGPTSSGGAAAPAAAPAAAGAAFGGMVSVKKEGDETAVPVKGRGLTTTPVGKMVGKKYGH